MNVAKAAFAFTEKRMYDLAMFRFFRSRRLSRLAPAVLAVGALIGMIDAFYLTLEYIEVLLHPGEPTPCTVNTLVSCTLTVQGVWGHYVPGVPNPMWGMLWYAGATAYGVMRFLGADFSRHARIFVGSVFSLGLLFSYRLYLASVLDLGGVCPFCLISTTVSTLIFLSFAVDDRTYPDPVTKGWILKAAYAFQAFSVAAFVIGLPIFIGRGLSFVAEPMEVVIHWSFPVMVLLVLAMAAGHAWAFRRFRSA